MAENQPPQDDTPTPPSGLPAVPTPLPPGLNADEYRRFQEFQRFQDYQRFVEAQQGNTSVPPPRPGQPSTEVARQLAGVQEQLAELTEAHGKIHRTLNPPLWRKILRNTWLHRLLWLAVIVVLAVWGIPTLIESFFGGGNGNGTNTSAPKEQNGTLEAHPKDAVRDMYTFVGDDDRKFACHLFRSDVAQQFALVFNAPSCEAAIDKLSAQVTNASAYSYPVLTAIPDPPGTKMTISSCQFDVSGGPRLGTFTLTQVQNGWEITGYARQEPCPAPSTTASAPPT